MERYEKREELGQGAHGKVFKALVVKPPPSIRSQLHPTLPRTAEDSKEDEEKHVTCVALKKMHVSSETQGLSMEAIREIKLMQELDHPNVMKLYDVFHSDHNVNLALEMMEGDLDDVIRDQSILLSEADVKQYMLMTMRAIDHCHRNWVLHRDLKPDNLLIRADGNLVLADFGLAKIYGSPTRRMSPNVCTLWYRAPELLYGARAYGTGSDMWSVGCIFAELLLRRPFFSSQSGSELSQLTAIFQFMGTPTKDQWPDMEALPCYTAFEPVEPTPLRQIFHAASEEAVDLLSKLLAFDPAKRLTASQALEHPFFSTQPQATPVDQLQKLKKKKKGGN